MSYLLLVFVLGAGSNPSSHAPATFFDSKDNCVNAIQAETGKSINPDAKNPQVIMEFPGYQKVIFTCVPK